MIKKILLVTMVLIIGFASLPVRAANSSVDQQLPTRWSYAYEWVNLHLLTWKSESKVVVYDQYATKRAQNIATAYSENKVDEVEQLTSRLKQYEKELNQTLQQSTNIDKTPLLETLQEGAIERQKILSDVRFSLQSEQQKKNTAALQEESVNSTKNTIAIVQDQDTAEKFSEHIVSVWRDPENSVKDEKETRVYAAGTSANGTIDDGVIIDGGEAKISKDGMGNLKIEYAPGTGPSSVTTDNGKRVWKIQMSDGSVVESYTAGSNVVVGQSLGTSSNVVVKTVAGTTGDAANVVDGDGGGNASRVIVGGKSVLTAEDAGNLTETKNTVNDATNSVNQSGPAGLETGGGQVIERTAP